jgi:hypothetical protein
MSAANPIQGLLDHAEEQEVLRVLLAEFAATYAAQFFSTEAFLAGGAAYLRGFLDALVSDFAAFAGKDLLDAAETFTKEVGLLSGPLFGGDREKILMEALARTSAGNAAFAEETAAGFGKWADSLRRAGMTNESITAALMADGGAEFSAVMRPWEAGLKEAGRAFAKSVDDVMYESGMARRAADGLPTGSTWVTMRDKSVCGQEGGSLRNSCWHRHGITKPMAEWTRLGLPGSGITLCRRNCRCMLVPPGYLKDGVPKEPVAAAETIAKAKERALKQHDKIVKYMEKRGQTYEVGKPTAGVEEQLRRTRQRVHGRFGGKGI